MTERQRGIQIFRPIIYGNSAYPLTPAEREANASPDHTHRWTVAVRSAASMMGDRVGQVGGIDDLGYFIKRVTFRLHDTYPNPTRNIDKPPFEVTETGWGEFDIQIKIQFHPEASEKTVTILHHLKLHPFSPPDLSSAPNSTLDPALIYAPPPTVPVDPSKPDGDRKQLVEAVHSWQYDEVVFTDPTRGFFDVLLANPPTPLPKSSAKKRPIPPNPALPSSLISSAAPPTPAAPAPGKLLPEFTQALERDEAERLDAAKRNVLDAMEAHRMFLVEKEQELKRLKEELDIM